MGIYTFTPNPVLDLGGLVDKLIPNEKSYVHEETRCPGGNGINAGRILHRLGAPVTLTGFLGGGVGQELKLLLDGEKLRHKFINIQGSTRIGITVSEKNSHLQTRLSFPGPRIQRQEKKALFDLILKIKKPAILVVGGSLPAGFSIRDLQEILNLCHEKNIFTVVDSPAPILKKIFHRKTLMIKPNLHEFEEAVGRPLRSTASVLFEARKLSKKIPLICVSSVDKGALLVTPRFAWYGEIPKVKVRSVVGAGDSMVGAMVSQLWQLRVLLKQNFAQFEADHSADLLRWGLAAACATLSHPGTTLGSRLQIESAYKKIKIKSVD
ncbi:MAG: 1-phosphofructokinase family hexose kinase [Pseudobdellovibrionaceae bacterium]